MTLLVHEDVTAHTKTMRALVRGADEVLISTYGIYAGITAKGENANSWGKPEFHSNTQDLLNECPDNTTIVVGQAEFKPCKVECAFCVVKEKAYNLRIDEHVKNWPNFTWIRTKEHHMKATCIRKGYDWIVFIGGRNLTDSNYTDLSFQVTGPEAAMITESVKRQLGGLL